MSILKKYIIRHHFLDDPLKIIRECTPYHCNMLNATEDASRMKITQGKLEEVSDKQWVFRYTRDSREQSITVLMTDEEYEFGGVKKGSGFPKLKPPTFK